MTSTTGTKTPETRSARRWTSALPDCAASTRRAICARRVSAPTRVARTTSRPPALVVAPVTTSPGPTSTGTGSPVSMDSSTALLPSTTTPSVATVSPGPDDEHVAGGELRDGDALLAGGPGALAEHRDVLGAQVEQGAQGGPGAALGAGLEPAADEHGGRDDGGDLEVDLVAALPGRGDEPQLHRHAGHPGHAEEQRVQRLRERGEHADADERVHGGRAVAGVDQGGAVERPGAPDHDGRGEGEDEPLPVVELQRRDHRQQQRRHGERGADQRALAQGPGLRVLARACTATVTSVGGRGGQDRAVPGLLDRGDGRGDVGALGQADGGLLGGVVDARLDAGHAVELLLDPHGARGARHAGDLERHRGAEHDRLAVRRGAARRAAGLGRHQRTSS